MHLARRPAIRSLIALLSIAGLLYATALPSLAATPVVGGNAGNTPPSASLLRFALGNPTRWLYGEPYPMDTAPVVMQDRTMLPVRYVAEPLGATVGWDAADRRVDIALGNHQISLWVDQSGALLDGQHVPIDASNSQVVPRIVDGRTLVPTRFVAETLGANVGWDPTQGAVTVDAMPSPAFSSSDFQRGISYAVYSSQLLNQTESDQLLRQLPGLGVKWVALIPVWYQDRADSTNIHAAQYDTASDDSLAHAVQLLHSMGLKVLLKPFVDSYDHTWRAKYNPPDWGQWFAAYTTFITHYATLGQQWGVDELCIGTEYDSSIPSQNARWRQVIQAVRARYLGALTYAADFTDYQQVDFWDALDHVGIDAYFPLSPLEDPDLPALKAGWEQAAQQIESWRNRSGITRPVIFTELGFPSYNGSTRSPGDWTLGTRPDQALQANAYEATFEVLASKPWLAGMYWWWWDNPTTADFGGGPTNMGYTPRGKLAAGVLSEWYHR